MRTERRNNMSTDITALDLVLSTDDTYADLEGQHLARCNESCFFTCIWSCRSTGN
jgi:hypothetical protein